MAKKKKTTEEKEENKSISKPDPQDNMEGPISSLVQTVKEEVEENGEKDEKEKD